MTLCLLVNLAPGTKEIPLEERYISWIADD